MLFTLTAAQLDSTSLIVDIQESTDPLLTNDASFRYREEEAAIAAYWVTDGIDSCRVGFLARHYIKHQELYNGQLAQVVAIYTESDDSPTKKRKYHRNKGCCRAIIISEFGTKKDDDASKKPAAAKKRKAK